MAYTNPYDRQSRLRGMMSRPTQGAVAFADDVAEAGGVMPTGGAFSTANDRYLKSQLRTTTDHDDRVALVGAMGLRDKANTSAQAAGANPMTGGYGWQLFDDYHAVKRNEAGLKGDRYNVGGISGGGDINMRPLSGGGPTRQINGGGGMRASTSSLEDVGDYQHRREMERLAREGGRLSLKALDDDVFYKGMDRQLGLTDAIMEGRGAAVRPEDRAFYNAGVTEDLKDYAGNREATRYWDPRQSSMRADKQRFDLERATAPARVQGEYSLNREGMISDWRRDVADTQANTRRQTATQVANDFLENIARLSREGAFGMNNGRPNPPPAEIQTAVNQILLQQLSGAGGGAPTAASGDDEQEIQMAMREFGVDRATAERELRARGVIR
jgi:hypothetical protein